MLDTLGRNSRNEYNGDGKEEEKERKGKRKGSNEIGDERRESWQALLRFSFLSLRYLYASHTYHAY